MALSHKQVGSKISAKIKIYIFSRAELKSRFFKDRELYWSNLPQNSNLGRESFVQKSGVRIPVGRVKLFAIFLFFFIFFILAIKNGILKHILPFLYINSLHRNKIKFVQYIHLSLLIFNWFYVSIFSFLWRIWKWKENGTKNLTFPDGDLNPRFLSKFSPTIWILREIRSIELTVLKKSRLYLSLFAMRHPVMGLQLDS
jgi:hypothetical protein